jgi:phosphoribosylanthranilate isomerase
MIKQIYSIITYEESVKTMEAGADHIGLVPVQNGGVPAHRVPLDVVDKIFGEAKRRGVKSVAIMLNKDTNEILDIAQKIQPDILHIAGMEYNATPEFAKQLKEVCPNTGLMQAVLIDGPEAIDRAKKYAAFCDYLLTDSGLAKDTGIGASGETHDWSIDAEIVRSVNIPVIIAGGMGPDNVEEAIKQIRPYGVDSLSKTSIKYEGGHMEKDIEKVREFCERADKAARELEISLI